MAFPSGIGGDQTRPASPAQYLGKRKRTVTPEIDTEPRIEDQSVQQRLKDALEFIKLHDSSARILKHPLPIKGEDGRTIKRQRTQTPDLESNSIEDRIARAFYKSIDDLLLDINQIKNSIPGEDTRMNGVTNSHTTLREQIDDILTSLSKLPLTTDEKKSSTLQTTNGVSPKKHQIPAPLSHQVVSLRSQTESGIRQLFSGLPRADNSTGVNAKRLPNGFELAEVLSVDKNDLQRKDARKFGDIFAPHRNMKTLEMPRGSTRALRGNNINFIPPYDNMSNQSRNDFKHVGLQAASWLRYATADKPKSESEEIHASSPIKNTALFKGAFSSFAPSTDNSRSLVTDADKSQQWWKKYGRPSATEAIFAVETQPDIAPPVENINDISDKDFEDMVANFIPEDDQQQEIDTILDEVSELIETLSSYQIMRGLEIARGPSSASKPSKDEQNTYEMLRNQLQLLISSLPPFAVAKLNGEQLEDLNISTQIILTAPDFVGTGQVDDHTMRKNRAAQTASVVSRNAVPTPSRPGYGTPASAYNAQARAYNNIPSTAFNARPANVSMYNTPRPAVGAQVTPYSQQHYRPNGPSIHTPSIQQFQRPVVNGFGSTTAPSPQPPHMQRPSQPGYQQRAQDSASFSSVSKAIVNGDGPQYQQRSYVTPSNSYTSSTLDGPPRQTTVDAAK